MRKALYALCFTACSLQAAAQIPLSKDYGVRVNDSDVPVYRCEVNPHRKVQVASWAQFEAVQEARVRVVRHGGGRIATAVVRPLAKGIKPVVQNDSIVLFTVPAARDGRGYALSVELDGDREHNLHLFIDDKLAETYEAPSPDATDAINWAGTGQAGSALDVFAKDARLIYFGPGEHRPKDLPSTEIKIPGNTTVFIAPGAVIKARLIVDHAENVRIIGRGVLLTPLRGVEITFSKHVLIDGLTIVNPQHYTIFGGQSEDITIRNVRSFSRHPWSDGIDMMCCKDVTIEDVFLRNNDDAFALYNHRWWYWGGSGNFHIRRATIWGDLAHPFNIGTHGDDRAPEGETLKDVYVEDCDILQADGDGIFAVRCGDQNRLENIHFENIRIEAAERGALFNVQVNFSPKYNRKPGDYIRGVWFKDIYFNGDATRLSDNIFQSYDPAHTVSDLHFDNIQINGKKQTVKPVITVSRRL